MRVSIGVVARDIFEFDAEKKHRVSEVSAIVKGMIVFVILSCLYGVLCALIAMRKGRA